MFQRPSERVPFSDEVGGTLHEGLEGVFTFGRLQGGLKRLEGGLKGASRRLEGGLKGA